MVQATQTGEPEHQPDYSDFEGTRPVSERQRFDSDALVAWLTRHVDGFAGPLTLEQFAGGQSNPTFKLLTPSRSYVMRAKPGPAAKLLPSAHAVEREYRVMHALAGTDVPVAKMLALCENESVIGRAFYVMEFVEGRVLWDQSLPGMTAAERAAIYDEMNRVIAALHSVDVTAVGLADYGKPGNYFARQIGRWSKQYIASETEPIDAMQRLIEWLPQHMPAETGERASIVHGDYRLDNLIFHPEEPCSTGSCRRSAIRSPTSPITAWRGTSTQRSSAGSGASTGRPWAFPTKASMSRAIANAPASRFTATGISTWRTTCFASPRSCKGS
jgi:Phosphotransferase enzyme family